MSQLLEGNDFLLCGDMNILRIFVNSRVLSQPITGVQRYLISILQNFPDDLDVIQSSTKFFGIRGHGWEQMILPLCIGKHLLWSPSNTGPLLVKKQIVTIHDTVFLDHPEWLNPRFALWYRFIIPRLARRSRAIITVSYFSKERIIEKCKIANNKIHVVYNGIDSRFSPASKENIVAAKNKLRIPGSRYILAVGSIEPRKNLRRLFEAWGNIADDISEEIWLIVAGGKGAKRIYDDVKLRLMPPRLHFAGHVPDTLLPAVYSGAIATVYVSLYEGFGLPALEAMACGSPVLTSDRTALPEVVGNSALLINPYQVDAISEGLNRLIKDEDLRTELRILGLEKAKEFSWKRAALKTYQILINEAMHK